MESRKIFKQIETRAEIILRREVMEANCLNFVELADKMSKQIITLCKKGLMNGQNTEA